jgi:hypothetical protein
MKKEKKPFNPDDFNIEVKVKNVLEDFPQLRENDYSKVSLNLELVKLNYEVVSPEYEDKKYASINHYLDLDVDYIV